MNNQISKTSDIKNIKEKLIKFEMNHLKIIIIITRLKKALMNAKVLNILGICLMKIRIKNIIFIKLKK